MKYNAVIPSWNDNDVTFTLIDRNEVVAPSEYDDGLFQIQEQRDQIINPELSGAIAPLPFLILHRGFITNLPMNKKFTDEVLKMPFLAENLAKMGDLISRIPENSTLPGP